MQRQACTLATSPRARFLLENSASAGEHLSTHGHMYRRSLFPGGSNSAQYNVTIELERFI